MRRDPNGALQAYVRRRLYGLRYRYEEFDAAVYDWWHGTDTHRETFLRNEGLTPEEARRGNAVYRPFWRTEFNQAIRALDARLEDFTFIDVGSGKGKILLLATKFPFARILGIENAPGLHKIAIANIQRFQPRNAGQRRIENFRCDALDWEMPIAPSVYFINNSFDEGTTEAFLSKLDHHASNTGVAVVLIYGNIRDVAERDQAFAVLRSLKLQTRRKRYVVFATPECRPATG